MFGPRNSAYAVNLTYETYRHTYIHIYIYHAKSRLNTPVWGSLRSPNNECWVGREGLGRGVEGVVRGREGWREGKRRGGEGREEEGRDREGSGGREW